MKWAVCISTGDALSLGHVRLLPADAAEACVDGQSIWVRGDDLTEPLDLALRKIPGARRFEVLEDNRARPMGAHLCVGHLPAGPWAPLCDLLALKPQPAALAGRLPAGVPCRLARADRELPANLLLTQLLVWTQWANNAPLIRLARLTFAVADDGRVVVRGTPLPPLPGQTMVEQAGVATLCGLRWWPPVDAENLRALLGLKEGDLAILSADGDCEVISGELFVPASRSAVRLTAEGASRE